LWGGTKNIDKPNIILIMTDDQGYGDLGCFGGDTGVSTPCIDQMAAEGRRFTNYYVAASLCSPSRASLLTGRYPVRAGLTGVVRPGWDGGLSTTEITFAETLGDVEYYCGCIGKWHVGHGNDDILPRGQGFDYYYGVPYSNDMSPEILMRNEEIIENPYENCMLTQKYTEEALQFLDNHSESPFFLYLSHSMPHDPTCASPEFVSSDRGSARYPDAIHEIDWSVGQVLTKLKELGIDNNTLVLFTSDNGARSPRNNAPLSGGKAKATEGGQRVPLVARWPETIPADTETDELVTAMDLLPTLTLLGGGSVPDDRIIDGHDIRPLLLAEEGAVTPYEYFIYYGKHQNLSAIRNGQFKYWGDVDGNQDEERRDVLYDLSTDIAESTDVKAQYPEYAEALRQTLVAADEAIRADEPMPGLETTATSYVPITGKRGSNTPRDQRMFFLNGRATPNATSSGANAFLTGEGKKRLHVNRRSK